MMPEKVTPFLGSLGETAGMIEQLRADLAAVEKQRGELDAKASDLNTRIAAWNSLRQAHGLQPL
jgi:hypothetical protein